ncbi:hypothetical protein QBC40DRAFT_300959 [Triangularia verruculosa]|uniref:DUF6604 domain-containing protein n=1 Tax=Triangularia verruculosa TaxID=2587418 RepID=A0AAN6X8N5_9PEZI|nr:hypothetical protein QBC40DRAFT_300959 [Triangularia verruculosa]
MSDLPRHQLYLRYKEATKYVTTWLVVKGREAHFPFLHQHSEIPVATLKTIAQWVASKNLSVPGTVLEELSLVIALRTQYSEGMREGNMQSDADRSHLHFIEALKSIQTSLGSIPKVADKVPIRNRDSASGGASTKHSGFGLLTRHDLPDSDVDSQIMGCANSLSATGIYDGSEYALKALATKEEAVFHFNLLCEEFNQIRATVESLWTGHVSGRMDLTAAACVTNMALLLAQTAELAVRPVIEDFMRLNQPQRSTYIRLIAHTLYIDVASAESILNGNIYFAVYNIIQKEGRSTTTNLHHTWTQYTKWHRDRNCESSICQILEELLSIGSTAQSHADVPLIDQLSQMVATDSLNGTVSLATVFGLETLLWVEQKLQTTGYLGNPLQVLNSLLSDSLEGLDSLPSWLVGMKVTERQVLNDVLLPSRQYLHKLRSSLQTSLSATEQTPIRTILSRNPILCGLIINHIRITKQDIGLSCEKHLGGITALVHIGNALVQEKYLENYLPVTGDVRTVFRQQAASSFFIGGQSPSERGSYLHQYSLTIGASITNNIPSTRNNSLSTRNDRKTFKPQAPLSRAVDTSFRDKHQRFSLNHDDVIRMLRTSHHGMNEKYKTGISQHHPLRDAALLINGEAALLATDYLKAGNTSWSCLKAIQVALGGSFTHADRGSQHTQANSVDDAVVIAGRVFDKRTLNNDELMKKIAKAYAAETSQQLTAP